jgi:hypothetical protein
MNCEIETVKVFAAGLHCVTYLEIDSLASFLH